MSTTTTTSTGKGGGLPDLSPIGGAAGASTVLGTMAGMPPGTIPSITGGAAAPSGAEAGAYSNRSPIHIAPVGVNLGAILQPYNEGSPENGGVGLDILSRYVDNTTAARVTPMTKQEFPMGLVIAAAGGLALLWILRR